MASRANVLLLGIVSFLNDLSSEMIMPILPKFIMMLGGSSYEMGLIGGMRDSMTSILKVLSGYLSDRTGRRKVFVFIGYLFSAAFKLLLSASSAWQHVLAFSSAERVGKGIRTAPRDAMIADSMPEERGTGFGIHRAMDTAGAILGSVTVFFLLCMHLSLNLIILIAALIAFISLTPLIPVKESVKEPPRSEDAASDRAASYRGASASFFGSMRKLPKPLRIFIIIACVFSLASFSYMFFIMLAMQTLEKILSEDVSLAITILLYTIFNIFYAVLATPFGILSDKYGKRRVISLGYLLFSLTCIGFAVAATLHSHIIPIFFALFAAYGIVYAMIEGTQRAFVSDMSEDALRATALGAYHTAVGIMMLPANVIAGVLWKISPSFTFIYGGIVSSIAFSLFIMLRMR